MTQGSQVWHPTAGTQKGLLSPLLQWQKLGKSIRRWFGKWFGKWLRKWLSSPHLSPCTAAGGQEHEGKEDLSQVPTIHRERHFACPTYPQIQEAQELFSNTHNNNSTVEGYSKLLHCPQGYHRDGYPDGWLHISLHHDRQTGGMCCTHLNHALPNDLQKDISKKALANEQLHAMFFHSELPIPYGNFKV